MKNKDVLNFMKEYSDSYLEDVRENGDATEYHANSLKYFGMKILINAVAKELGEEQDEIDDNYTEKYDYSISEKSEKKQDDENYGVNLCSFRNKHHAEQLRDEIIKETGYRAFVETCLGYFRVRIGYFAKGEAEEILHDLKETGYQTACVCTERDESGEKISAYPVTKQQKIRMKTEKEELGKITLGKMVYVGDPSFFCDGQKRYSKVEDVLPGTYVCSLQKTYQVGNRGLSGGTVDFLEVKHSDYDKFKKGDSYKTTVSIYSTVAGVYDNSAVEDFIKLVEETQESLWINDKFKKWNQDVLQCTCKRVPNPEYVPFEQSKFWNDKFLELQNESYSQECLSDYYSAKAEYDALRLQETISDWESGGTIDDAVVVFGHLEMTDVEVAYEIERNEDGKMIAIKFVVNDFAFPEFNFSK